jgi:hypothetical protein
MTSPRSPGPEAASPGLGATVAAEDDTARRSNGSGGSATRTVHVIIPATHRPLCGYEEERPTSPERASTVACPECMALLRSGLLGRRLGVARH